MPVATVVFLTTFLGIWFAVIGVFEMIDALHDPAHLGRPAAVRSASPGSARRPRTADSQTAGGGSRGAGRNMPG